MRTVSNTIYKFKELMTYELQVDEASDDDGHVLLNKEPDTAIPVEIGMQVLCYSIVRAYSHHQRDRVSHDEEADEHGR